MDQLESLKTKYASALQAITRSGTHLTHLHVQDNKLVIQGSAPSEQAKNEVWTAIKAVDPHYADVAADIRVDSSQPSPAASAPAAAAPAASARSYTVKAGDTLSKISKEMYGSAQAYMKIFEANRDQLADPDKIRPGQTLKIPA
jgi:nucleoid-associated protein YgaU